tara:strand:+ start:347 stop:526 length:180 start_codon:yes stop_codon:yes gene_type:complete
MSNIHNDRIKEDIMEEVESMSLHEFQELLDKHHFKALNQYIDEHMGMIVEKLFEERCDG